jgi:hypothetical protein
MVPKAASNMFWLFSSVHTQKAFEKNFKIAAGPEQLLKSHAAIGKPPEQTF